MGRHSASYIAARQGVRTGPTARGAATYVGRVGALALALGVGAAVVGGAGLANAEGTSDKGSGSESSSGGNAGGGGAGGASASGGSAGGASSDAGSVKAPSESAATEAAPETAGADGTDDTPPSADSTGVVKTHRPGSLDVPKMVFDGGVPRHRPVATADAEPSASAGTTKATGATETSGASDEPTVRPRTSDSRQAHQPTTSQVRPKTDDAAPTVSAEVSRATPSPAADPAPVTSLAASVTAVPVQPLPVVPAPVVAHPIFTLIADTLNAISVTVSTITTGWPLGPIHLVVAALQLIHREIDNFVVNLHAAADFYSSAQPHVPPATATTTPAPGDETQTAYGDIGKWMLESNGQISDYGGQPYQGKTLLEAVNVIIVDPNSTTPDQAAERLNTAMFWSGFPAQPIHSTGFEGEIDDVVYGQQPTGLLEGFSDNLFILPNDHGRIFGPDPVETSSGYVWSGAFSTEALTIYNLLPAHAYVSSNMARTALATRLILSGQATYVGMVPLDNAVDDSTTTTGDHDGYAVVLKLT